MGNGVVRTYESIRHMGSQTQSGFWNAKYVVIASQKEPTQLCQDVVFPRRRSSPYFTTWLKAVAKDPEDRYQRVSEMVEMLKWAAGEKGPPEETVGLEDSLEVVEEEELETPVEIIEEEEPDLESLIEIVEEEREEPDLESLIDIVEETE